LTNVSVAGQWQGQFVYEGLGRKRIERDYSWTGSAWQQTNEVQFVCDGMLVLQERHFEPQLSTNDPQHVVTYTRGLDLSGSRQGAGGIGGLLARTDANGSAYYHADGAGNVTALMDAGQHILARYLYDPFGRQLGQWGELAAANRYRFSSKPVHALSGLYDYGFRHYDPALQRWLTEDPIGEGGGINLHQAFFNAPLNFVDRDGLDNIFNPGAGQNAVPNIVAYLDLETGGTESGYQPGEDPFWMLGDMTIPGGGPSMLLEPPGFLQDLVTLTSDTSGEEKALAAASLGMLAISKTKCVPKGTIYRVPGSSTRSGKPYIGRHNKPEPSKTRRSNDGRDRTQAEVVDTYDPGDTMQGRLKEQGAIDAEGGLEYLDNKRNEIRKPK
jgi:RHS repeat-associated protein